MASRCAVEWRMTSSAAGSFSVTMESFASFSMTKDVSTSLSFTRPARAALARPAPMLAATSATVTGASNFFWLPSGSVMTGIGPFFKTGSSGCGPRIFPKRPRRINSDNPVGGPLIFAAFVEVLTGSVKTRTGSKPLRFAVVGLGHIAQAAVLPAFKHARPHVELTALVSGTKSKLKQLGERYDVEHRVSYADAEKLFDSGAIDAVYVATPNTEHVPWVLRAAKSGLHVLCEKPLGASVRDCERMIDACERNSVHLMTAYRLHFERCNLEVADLVRRKKLGEPRFFNSQFSMQVKAGNIRTQSELAGGPEWDIGI